MDLRTFINGLQTDFSFDRAQIQEFIANFHSEMKLGLCGKRGSLRMLPAFVDRAKGSEKGGFIALDFGGTNFRVMAVELKRPAKVKIKGVMKFTIPKSAMCGSGVDLFGFIAKSISKFFDEHSLDRKKSFSLGFTFSFPMDQKDIRSGLLINWTKGFSASGVVGKDVVKLLEIALRKNGLTNLSVDALVNDTVGTLEAASYCDRNADIGVILGTGTNACYCERYDRIKKLKLLKSRDGKMIINIEWGNFNKLKINRYDEIVDKKSNNPKEQRLEKMISGMYLGKIATQVIVDAQRRGVLFSGKKIKIKEEVFSTEIVSMMEGDRSLELKLIAQYLSKIGIKNSTTSDRQLLKRIFTVISDRAANMSAAAIFAVLKWIDPNLRSNHVIGVDGTLYEKYPRFKERINKTLKAVAGVQSKKIKVRLTHDGSGIGVAIAAAVAGSG